MPETPTCILGALAVELRPGATATRAALPTAEAGDLAERVARDLARAAPDAAALDFALVAALYDPVEVLRPGWPLHDELERLAARAPGVAGGRVIGFGTGDDARMPAPLRPDDAHANGPLRLLPWLLRGPEAAITAIGDVLEETLLDTGMAAADTALAAQEGFGAATEHVRLLTINDLAAMTAMQYEHAGLAPLWPLIEVALLAPGGEQWLDAPPEPLARYADGHVRIAMLDADAWAEQGFAPADLEPAKLARAFERFQMRHRQIAAVLGAHAIPVVFDHCGIGRDPRGVLSA
jgi:hypothetical protein